MISVMSDTRIFRRMLDMEISDLAFITLGTKLMQGFLLKVESSLLYYLRNKT